MGLTSSVRRPLISNQLLQVPDQVVQLGYLNVVLDDVARVEEADSLDVLLDGLVVLFLLEELVSVLFDDLTLDLAGEVCLFGDGLRLSVVRLLHQVVDLDVVFHGVQLDKLSYHVVVLIIELSDVIDAFLTLRLFDLHIDDDAIGGWVPEHGDLVLEVVDRELRRSGRHRLRT